MLSADRWFRWDLNNSCCSLPTEVDSSKAIARIGILKTPLIVLLAHHDGGGCSAKSSDFIVHDVLEYHNP
jgi:hypothetical protein